jgi:hypothetical protein
MKNVKKIALAMGISIYLFACKQEIITIPQTASINVTNAIIGGAKLSLNTDLQTVANNGYGKYILYAGQSQVNLYVPAVAATSIAAAIPAVTYYNETITTVSNGFYSLFLSGASPSQVDATLITETYPYAYVDSLVGVRFINLSPNSNPISVNIKGNTNGSEVASLGYKAYGNFKTYAAKKVNPSYVFEVRDAGTGNLITSYTLTTTTPLFHNVTIALRGLIASPGIIIDNDY